MSTNRQRINLMSSRFLSIIVLTVFYSLPLMAFTPKDTLGLKKEIQRFAKKDAKVSSIVKFINNRKKLFVPNSLPISSLNAIPIGNEPNKIENVRATRVSNSTFAMVYQAENTGSPEIRVMLGTVSSGGNVSFGNHSTVKPVDGTKSSNIDIAALDGSNLIIVADSANAGEGHALYAVSALVSGSDITVDPIQGDNFIPVQSPTSSFPLADELRVTALSSSKFVVTFVQNNASNNVGRAIVGTFDSMNGTVKFNAGYSDFGDDETDYISLTALSGTQAVVAFRSGGTQIRAKVLDVDLGTDAVTAGGGFNAIVGVPCLRTAVAAINSTQFLLAYEVGSTSTTINVGKCSVSGLTISPVVSLNGLHAGSLTNSLTLSKIGTNNAMVNVLEGGMSYVYRLDATSDAIAPDVTDSTSFAAESVTSDEKAITVGMSNTGSVSIAVVMADGTSGAYGHDQGASLPLLKVLGNDTEITSGATLPSSSDNTDFGAITINDSIDVEFEIRNDGGATLTLGSITSSDAQFTNITTVSGVTIAPTTSFLFRIRYRAGSSQTGLPDSATIVINSDDPNSPFTFKVGAFTIARLNKPTITSKSSTRTEITLEWTDNNDDELGYDVYRAQALGPPGGQGPPSFGPPELIAETLDNTTSFTDFGLKSNTTYSYYVVAISFDPNLNSSPSDTSVVTTLSNAPIAPSALNALALSQTEIQLEWRDNSTNETGFDIFRRKKGEAMFSKITTTALDANTEFYIDQDLDTKTEYAYRVVALGAEGNSPPTDTATATTLSNAPDTPSDLLVETISGTALELDWVDNSDNELGFVIYRSVQQFGTYSIIDTVGNNTVIYQDTALTLGTTYYYYVHAYNGDGLSLNRSNIASGVPQNVPLMPSNIQYNVLSNSSIEITWDIDTPPITERTANGFKVEAASLLGTQGIGQRRRNWPPKTFTNGKTVARTTNDGFSDLIFSEIGTVDASTKKFTASNLIPNQRYVFRLRAFNDNGNSPYAPSQALVTPVDGNVSVPSAPTELKVTPVSQSELDLTWKDNSDNELVFKIERKTSSEADTEWTEIAQVIGGTTSFSSTGLLADSTYQYRIRASNQGGESAYSNVSEAKVECNLVVLVTNNSGSNTICSGKAALLVVNTNVSDATYQWKLNGINIDNANLPIYNATETGEYNCQVISGSCSKSSSIPSVVIVTNSFQVSIRVADSTTNTFQATVSGAQGYQWYKDYQPVANATESSYQATQDGTYFVVVTNEGCASTSNLINWTPNVTTGLEDNQFTQSISISPNPSATESVLQMNNEEFGPYKVLITDAQGKVLEVLKGEKKTKKLEVDLPIKKLARGLYLVKIQMKKKEAAKKLLKE